MQRASVRERMSQIQHPIVSMSRKPVLRVIEGGASYPSWQELMGLLLFILTYRRKKLEIVTIPLKSPEPSFFDDVPDTGVHEIAAFHPAAELTNDRLDEIIRDAVPVPSVRFHVSGEKKKPEPKKRRPAVPQEEREPFPRRVSPHALGQFARAYLKARGQLGEYIDRRIKERLGPRKAALLDYAERLRLRRMERKKMADQLIRLACEEGRQLRDNEERIEAGIAVIHIGRGPSNSYFLRFDPETGVVLGFYSAQGFNRHKAYRRARKKSHREGGRRFH